MTPSTVAGRRSSGAPATEPDPDTVAVRAVLLASENREIPT